MPPKLGVQSVDMGCRMREDHSGNGAAPHRPPMKVEIGPDGHVLGADDLGRLLRIEPALVLGLMQSGAITSQFETGIGADAGRFRLTFWHGQVRVRLTCDADGTVLSHVRTDTRRGAPP